jgi:FkbM family methyltransferase
VQPGYAAREPWLDKLEAYYYKVFERANVYELLRRAYYFFGIPKHGVIHIGARYAEELRYYKALGLKDILWIEADPEAAKGLQQAVCEHPGSKVAIFAAADSNGTIELHITSNDGHSSSILTPDMAELYPTITVDKVISVPKRKLDDYLTSADKAKYNILVMDIQGAELIALKGAVQTLKSIDAVVAEINYIEFYKGAGLIKDLDAFMIKHGFTRVDTISGGYYTGDALYVKDKFFAKRRCGINNQR